MNVSDPTSDELKAFENDTDFLNSTSDISTNLKAITLTDVLEADVYEICAKQGICRKDLNKNIPRFSLVMNNVHANLLGFLLMDFM